MPLGLYALIGVVAYLCANVLVKVPSPGLDLLVKSLAMLVASALIALIGVRAIRAVDASSFESMPWPLDRLGRMQLGRPSRT